MSLEHLDRLSAADTAFLQQEDRGMHAHIGWVMIAAGPPPTYADLIKHVKSRLHLVPRYRQKIAYPLLQLARPMWIDDPRFNIEYHLRHSALPAPGSLDKLRALVGRIFSQGLDRSKPLWELWLVQGLRDNRFAIINKAHRALVDGIGGFDITTVLFDTSKESRPVPPPTQAWIPRREPEPAELMAVSAREFVTTPLEIGQHLWTAWNEPSHAYEQARQVIQGIGEVASALLDPPSPTPLNVPIGTHRRVAWKRFALSDFKIIKNAFGATINDVYLTVLTGMLAYWLRSRGVATRGLRLRAAIPISLQGDGQGGRNRIVEYFAPLPVSVNDPVERLRIVRRALDDLKESKQALGAQAIAAIQDFSPPALLARTSRLSFSSRLFNLVATNVPGPQFPLFLMGHEVEQIGPVGFLIEDCALMTVMVSYNGMLELGLTVDADAVPDLDDLCGYADDALKELLDAADAAKRHPKTKTASKRKRAKQEQVA